MLPKLAKLQYVEPVGLNADFTFLTFQNVTSNIQVNLGQHILDIDYKFLSNQTNVLFRLSGNDIVVG